MFDLNRIPQTQGEVQQINVTFSIDFNSLTVRAVHNSIENELTIRCKGSLSKENIKRMIGEAEKYRLDDENAAKSSLMSFCFDVKRGCNFLIENVNKSLEWIQNSPRAGKREYENHRDELETMWNQIKKKLRA